MARLDWIGVREGLRAARIAAGAEERQLADAGVCSLSNIYRIENVADRPDHKPDLATVERWLEATTGEGISDFLRRYERPAKREGDVKIVTFPVTVEDDNTSRQLPSAWEARYGSVVGARSGDLLPDLSLYEARLFQRFAIVTLRAANAAVSEAENRSTTTAESARGEAPDRNSGRTPPSERPLTPPDPPDDDTPDSE